jgi:membrane protease YdiL (CAAX protease family)
LAFGAVLQALAFGLAHTGYGTWAHILGPFLFGLAMAWVALRLGILAAIVLHAAVDIISFSIDIAPFDASAYGLMGGLLVAAIVAIVILRAAPFRRLLPDALLRRWSSPPDAS